MALQHKKRKICIISHGSYPLLINSQSLSPIGGAEVQLVTLGIHFSLRGYEVHFIVDDFKQKASIKLDNGIIVQKSSLRYMGGSNYYLVPDWIKLLKNIFDIGADIHILKLPNHLLFPIGVYCRLFRKKLIFVCQLDRDVNLGCLRNDVNLFEFLFYRLGLRLTDYVIAQTETQRKKISEFFFGRISVIKNILSLNKVEKAKKEKYIVWVGSNLPRKRPEIYLEIAKKCPQFSFKMILSLGKANSVHIDIKKECSQIANIEYIGTVPFQEINKFFRKAAILVSTSELEGFPNVFLQAWQHETPVISLGVDPEGLIRKRDIGRVAFSVEEMISNIKQLMHDDELRARLGANGKEYVEVFHDPDEIVDKYCNMFGSVI